MASRVSTRWFIRIGRTAHRLQRATTAGADFLFDQDFVSWHYEGRGLTHAEELSAWWSGFKRGWRAAGSDGHPWFDLAAARGTDAIANVENE